MSDGEPITFQAVQREAGVSHAFLHNHADLRGRIERLGGQAHPAPEPASPADEQNTLALALTGQIARLKKQHREEGTGTAGQRFHPCRGEVRRIGFAPLPSSPRVAEDFMD
ncbi:hypothetical protein [Streptomyces sp. NPDC102437]|uniref:hypothetical protein n=1 Tax=Streptomyces sp. NPDC102437 TaxID=3366175 RepID=UPI00381AFA5D